MKEKNKHQGKLKFGKTGFTLVELLGVITLLAVLALLAIPAVAKNISRGKKNLYKAQLENFKKAASSWMAIHTMEVPDGEVETGITLGCLKVEGLLDTSIENPVTGVQFPNDMVIKIKSSSNQFIYTVEENSGTEENVSLPTDKCHFDPVMIKD